MKKIVVKAPSLEQAREIAVKNLDVPQERLRHRIISKPSKGFLGFLANENYEVEFSVKDPKKHLDMRIDNALQCMDEIDGHFTIDIKEEDVILTVYPAGEKGKPVLLDEVLNRLSDVKAIGYDKDNLQRLIDEASTKPIRVGNVIYDESLDGYVKMEIMEEEMTAFLTIFPPKKGGRPISLEKIRVILEQNQIIYGINDELLEESVREKNYYHPFTVAEGSPVAHGRDARIEYFFNAEQKIEFREDQHGRVDFRELGLIQNVAMDEVLAKKIPPTEGKEGITIKGRVLPPIHGKDVRLSAGENTRLSENMDSIISEIEGRVVLRKESVCVEPLFNVTTVDYSTGNIEFNGTVVIEEKIEDGFKVTATGDIFINKNVGFCNLESKQGQIIVTGGIMGKNKGVVKAEGPVTARFIENATVISRSDIIVEKAIMHSRILCGGEVQVMGERGLIVGGSVQAKEGITAKEIGSIAFTKTELTAGFDPDTLKKIAEIEEQIIAEQEKLEKFDLALASLNKMKKKGELENPDEYKEKSVQLEEYKKRQEQIIKQKKDRITEVKVEGTPMLGAKIRIRDRIYPGVRMEIARETMTVNEEYKFISFFFDPDSHEIKWGSF